LDPENSPYRGSNKFWLKLDNAALIFPAILSEKSTAVFRISAVLKDPVKIKYLLKAIHSIENRFPYYKVQLKKGFFWYYLEHLNLPVSVVVDNEMPCRKFHRKDIMFRILVLKNRISVEFSHILTDGSGGFEYLKTLLVLYFKESGVRIPEDIDFLYPDDIISQEEYEDSYDHHFNFKIASIVKQSKAFHLPYSLNPERRFDILNIVLPLKELKNKASEKAVTITMYLVSVYLLVLQDIFENLAVLHRHKRNMQLRVQVPVNLRNIYPSRTMRNFSLFIMPQIDLRLGHYSFDEIIKTVYHQMNLGTEEKLISKNIARNVGSQKKIYVRGTPLFLKSLILKYIHYYLGPRQYSGVLTNLGRVSFPSEVCKLIDNLVFTPPPPHKRVKISCGIIGFNENLVLSFGNITKSKELEERFIKLLTAEGISCKVLTHSN
jgi:NRPS condensation-like uncharacterized protein